MGDDPETEAEGEDHNHLIVLKRWSKSPSRWQTLVIQDSHPLT